jgi:succinyl-diaminopimelate desuccinylase
VTKHPGERVLDLSANSVELTRAVCDIPSVSGDETTLADAIELSVTGYEHLQVIRFGDTVVARTELGRAQRIIIAGHIDTVPINNNLPCRDETEDGVEYLWGRGTVDMKSGLAVQLKLAAELVHPRYDITWIWYDHEEVDAELNGLKVLSAAHPELLRADFAILGEPSNAKIEGGCNGTLRAVVRAKGVQAHSARPWMGDNAIHRLADILARLVSHVPETRTVDGLDYRESLQAVGISGGVAGNVVPDVATLTLNFRFAPDRSVDDATNYVTAFCEGFEVEIIDSAPGARPGLDTDIAQDFVAVVGGDPAPKYGWTDVSRLSTAGIPAVNFGPGDPSLAHSPNEQVSLSELELAHTTLGLWLFLS